MNKDPGNKVRRAVTWALANQTVLPVLECKSPINWNLIHIIRQTLVRKQLSFVKDLLLDDNKAYTDILSALCANTLIELTTCSADDLKIAVLQFLLDPTDADSDTDFSNGKIVEVIELPSDSGEEDTEEGASTDTDVDDDSSVDFNESTGRDAGDESDTEENGDVSDTGETVDNEHNDSDNSTDLDENTDSDASDELPDVSFALSSARKRNQDTLDTGFVAQRPRAASSDDNEPSRKRTLDTSPRATSPASRKRSATDGIQTTDVKTFVTAVSRGWKHFKQDRDDIIKEALASTAPLEKAKELLAPKLQKRTKNANETMTFDTLHKMYTDQKKSKKRAPPPRTVIETNTKRQRVTVDATGSLAEQIAMLTDSYCTQAGISTSEGPQVVPTPENKKMLEAKIGFVTLHCELTGAPKEPEAYSQGMQLATAESVERVETKMVTDIYVSTKSKRNADFNVDDVDFELKTLRDIKNNRAKCTILQSDKYKALNVQSGIVTNPESSFYAHVVKHAVACKPENTKKWGRPDLSWSAAHNQLEMAIASLEGAQANGEEETDDIFDVVTFSSDAVRDEDYIIVWFKPIQSKEAMITAINYMNWVDQNKENPAWDERMLMIAYTQSHMKNVRLLTNDNQAISAYIGQWPTYEISATEKGQKWSKGEVQTTEVIEINKIITDTGEIHYSASTLADPAANRPAGGFFNAIASQTNTDAGTVIEDVAAYMEYNNDVFEEFFFIARSNDGQPQKKLQYALSEELEGTADPNKRKELRNKCAIRSLDGSGMYHNSTVTIQVYNAKGNEHRPGRNQAAEQNTSLGAERDKFFCRQAIRSDFTRLAKLLGSFFGDAPTEHFKGFIRTLINCTCTAPFTRYDVFNPRKRGDGKQRTVTYIAKDIEGVMHAFLKCNGYPGLAALCRPAENFKAYNLPSDPPDFVCRLFELAKVLSVAKAPLTSLLGLVQTKKDVYDDGLISLVQEVFYTETWRATEVKTHTTAFLAISDTYKTWNVNTETGRAQITATLSVDLNAAYEQCLCCYAEERTLRWGYTKTPIALENYQNGTVAASEAELQDEWDYVTSFKSRPKNLGNRLFKGWEQNEWGCSARPLTVSALHEDLAPLCATKAQLQRAILAAVTSARDRYNYLVLPTAPPAKGASAKSHNLARCEQIWDVGERTAQAKQNDVIVVADDSVIKTVRRINCAEYNNLMVQDGIVTSTKAVGRYQRVYTDAQVESVKVKTAQQTTWLVGANIPANVHDDTATIDVKLLVGARANVPLLVTNSTDDSVECRRFKPIVCAGKCITKEKYADELTLNAQFVDQRMRAHSDLDHNANVRLTELLDNWDFILGAKDGLGEWATHGIEWLSGSVAEWLEDEMEAARLWKQNETDPDITKEEFDEKIKAIPNLHKVLALGVGPTALYPFIDAWDTIHIVGRSNLEVVCTIEFGRDRDCNRALEPVNLRGVDRFDTVFYKANDGKVYSPGFIEPTDKPVMYTSTCVDNETAKLEDYTLHYNQNDVEVCIRTPIELYWKLREIKPTETHHKQFWDELETTHNAEEAPGAELHKINNLISIITSNDAPNDRKNESIVKLAKLDYGSPLHALLVAGCYDQLTNWPGDLLQQQDTGLDAITPENAKKRKSENFVLAAANTSDSEDNNDLYTFNLAAVCQKKQRTKHQAGELLVPWTDGEYIRHKLKNIYAKIKLDGNVVSFVPLSSDYYTKLKGFETSENGQKDYKRMKKLDPSRLGIDVVIPVCLKEGDVLFKQGNTGWYTQQVTRVSKNETVKLFDETTALICTYDVETVFKELTDDLVEYGQIQHILTSASKPCDHVTKEQFVYGQNRTFDTKILVRRVGQLLDARIIGDSSTTPMKDRSWVDDNYDQFVDKSDAIQTNTNWRAKFFEENVFERLQASIGYNRFYSGKTSTNIARAALRVPTPELVPFALDVTTALAEYLHATAKWNREALRTDAIASVTRWINCAAKNDLCVTTPGNVQDKDHKYNRLFNTNRLAVRPLDLRDAVNKTGDPIDIILKYNITDEVLLTVRLEKDEEYVKLVRDKATLPDTMIEIGYAQLIALTAPYANATLRHVIPTPTSTFDKTTWEQSTDGQKPWEIVIPNDDPLWEDRMWAEKNKTMETCFLREYKKEMAPLWVNDKGQITWNVPPHAQKVVGNYDNVLKPITIAKTTEKTLAELKQTAAKKFDIAVDQIVLINLDNTDVVPSDLKADTLTVSVSTYWRDGFYDAVLSTLKNKQQVARRRYMVLLDSTTAWDKWSELAKAYQMQLWIPPSTNTQLVQEVLINLQTASAEQPQVFVEKFQWDMMYNQKVWTLCSDWFDAVHVENAQIDTYAFADKLLGNLGVQTKEVGAEGDCFFYTIAWWVNTFKDAQTPVTALDCRTEICNYLERNGKPAGWTSDEPPELERAAYQSLGVQPIISATENSDAKWLEWIAKMREQGTYNDEWCIKAASDVYSLHLRVYSCWEQTDTLRPVQEYGVENNVTASIVHMAPHRGAAHYRVVVNKYASTPLHWSNIKLNVSTANNLLTNANFTNPGSGDGITIIDALRLNRKNTNSDASDQAWGEYTQYAEREQSHLILAVCGDYISDEIKAVDLAHAIHAIHKTDPIGCLLTKEQWTDLGNPKCVMLIDAWFKYYTRKNQDGLWGKRATWNDACEITQLAEKGGANVGGGTEQVDIKFPMPTRQDIDYNLHSLYVSVTSNVSLTCASEEAFRDGILQYLRKNPKCSDADLLEAAALGLDTAGDQWAYCHKTVLYLKNKCTTDEERRNLFSTNIAASKMPARWNYSFIKTVKHCTLINKKTGNYYTSSGKKADSVYVSMPYAVDFFTQKNDFKGLKSYGYYAEDVHAYILYTEAKRRQRDINKTLRDSLVNKNKGSENTQLQIAGEELIEILSNYTGPLAYILSLAEWAGTKKPDLHARPFVYQQLKFLYEALRNQKARSHVASITEKWEVDYTTQTIDIEVKEYNTISPEDMTTLVAKAFTDKPQKNYTVNHGVNIGFKQRAERLTKWLKEKFPSSETATAETVATQLNSLSSIPAWDKDMVFVATHNFRHAPKLKLTLKNDANTQTLAVAETINYINNVAAKSYTQTAIKEHMYLSATVEVSGTRANVAAVQQWATKKEGPYPKGHSPIIPMDVQAAKNMCGQVKALLPLPKSVLSIKDQQLRLCQYLAPDNYDANPADELGDIAWSPAVEIAQNLTFPFTTGDTFGRDLLDKLSTFTIKAGLATPAKYVLIGSLLQTKLATWVFREHIRGKQRTQTQKAVRDVYAAYKREFHEDLRADTWVEFGNLTGICELFEKHEKSLQSFLESKPAKTVHDAAV